MLRRPAFDNEAPAPTIPDTPTDRLEAPMIVLQEAGEDAEVPVFDLP